MAAEEETSSSGYRAKGKAKGKAPPVVNAKGDGKGKGLTYKEQMELSSAAAAAEDTKPKTQAAQSIDADAAIRTDYPSANLSAESAARDAIRCRWESFGGPNATYVLLQSQTGEEGSFEPVCFGGGHAGQAKYANEYVAMRLAADTQYYFQICAFEEGAPRPGPPQPIPPISCIPDGAAADAMKASEKVPSSLAALFDEYEFSEGHRRIFHAMKRLQNMPAFFNELADEEILWAVAVGAFDLPDGPSKDAMRSFESKVEERLRRLEQAECRFGWFSLKWTKPTMKRLLSNWFCGMLIIDPDLRSREGNPIQWVREYYGDESGYPHPEDQSEEWKKESRELYVLMVRSTCRAYPMATKKGIVSFSDMQNFDHAKYDMGSKERNADVGSLIPNKLARMITFNPDEQMQKLFDNLGENIRRQFGLAQYEDLAATVAAEGDFLNLPQSLPTFVGGAHKVDILKCLTFLFRREPEALALCLETHSEMVSSGELPCPKHMQS